MLDVFEMGPETGASGVVLWMHGLGATNRDFESVVPELALPSVRFVFPAAPRRSVTVNGGMVMPAWYDILTWQDPPLREHEPDVRSAGQEIEAVLLREHQRGVPWNRIVVAGFSQGGAMALHVGFRQPQRLAGVMSLSAYLLLPETFEVERNAANSDTPVLLCHGTYDPVVPLGLGRAARDRIAATGTDLTYHEYPMDHSLCLEEVRDIRRWLEPLTT